MSKSLLLFLAPLILGATSLLADTTTVATHSFSSNVSGSGVRRVLIEVPASETVVVARSGDDIKVEGTARREYDGDDERTSAQRLVDGAAITVRLRGRNASIERVFTGSPSWRQRNLVKFRFTVYVPENMSVEIKQSAADISLRGSFGDLDAELKVGNMRLEMPKKQVAELTAHSRIGEVTTDLPDRTIVKQGMFAGATHFLNDGGKSVINLKVNVGQIAIDLK